jgi:hypothetical protein
VGIKSPPFYSGGVAEGDLRSYPILIDTGKPSLNNNVPMFKFELGWLLRDGFMDMVREVWNSVSNPDDKMKCW